MPQAALAILADVSTASVLTLVLPLGVLIAVLVWYVWIWRRGAGEG